MILKKLAKAIQRQDWSTMMIEIIIVVVGIFFGLQVDDWNNKRLALIAEGEYLERLASEVDGNLKSYQRAGESYDNVQQ